MKNHEVKQDPLHSALDSFYSDIAAIETPVCSEISDQPLFTEDGKMIEGSSMETNSDNNKKKKKKVGNFFCTVFFR